MCANFTLEKHVENAVACKFFGMRRSAAASGKEQEEGESGGERGGAAH